jgi:hypothetical protein
MATILQYIGIGIFIIGGIGLLIETFKTSILWGVGCLLINPLTIIYLFCYWHKAKKPFSIQVAGFILMFTGAYLQGNLPQI